MTKKTIIYYNILNIIFGKKSLIYKIIIFEHLSSAKLPGHHEWTDDYFLWSKYIYQKSIGKNITLENMREKYFNTWKNELKKTSEKMNKRDMSGLID